MERGEGLARLEVLVGEWTLEATMPTGEPLAGSGRSTFEWHDSHAFLVQRSTIQTPNAPDSVSLIGYDDTNETFVQLYSDDRGVCRIYEMRLGRNEWTLQREGHPFPQRFVGAISADGNTIVGRWEKAEHGLDFTIDFHLTYRRTASKQ
jgi:hypothetical protein